MDYIDFLYQSAPKTGEDSIGDKLDDAVIIEEKKPLVQLLSFMTMEGDFPINVRIGTQIFDYHSFLKLDIGGVNIDETNLYLIESCQ
jgi:hypothetical protein